MYAIPGIDGESQIQITAGNMNAGNWMNGTYGKQWPLSPNTVGGGTHCAISDQFFSRRVMCMIFKI